MVLNEVLVDLEVLRVDLEVVFPCSGLVLVV